MALRELVDYIKQYSAQGYSIASIRANLISSGYTPQQIDAAIETAFGGKKPFPLRLVLFGVAALVVLVLLVYGLVILLAPAGEEALTLVVTNAPTEVQLGIPLSFSRTVTVTDEDPVLVHLTYEIIHEQTRERVLIQEEDVTVRRTSKKTMRLVINPSARSGDYNLRVIAEYSGLEQVRTHSFIVPTTKLGRPTPSTPESLGEAIVTPPPTKPGVCHPTCNDYDPCTLDKCVGGSCVFDPRTPCCGNFECETGETEVTCAQDCKVRPITQGEAILQIRARAEQAASNNPGDAVNLCRGIAVQAQADSCMKAVAYASKRSDICKHIAGSKLRDACYLDFALKNKQSSVCQHVGDRWMKQSCIVYTTSPTQV